jgi:hypothetical protein
MSGPADQVHDRLVILALLQMRNVQLDGLVLTQTVCDKNGQEREISLTIYCLGIWSVKQLDSLNRRKPRSRVPLRVSSGVSLALFRQLSQR